MKRTLWILPATVLVGCSTSPCADFLDHFWPMKPPAATEGSFGGVCNTAPAGPGIAGGPVAPPGLTPNVVVPGNAPVVAPPGAVVPNNNVPYVPGAATPPPLNSGVAPSTDLNGTPTSGAPLPPPPASECASTLLG
ncbi:MAG: hypothetical protein QM703_15290 [Gemmatales bacterium]